MRHLKVGRALGVKPAHRRAMMRNMVTSLIEHERITTILARAKELRQPLDKMISLGKKGDLSARRKALTFVKSKLAMKSLFGELAERYGERPGGYSRIIRLSARKGDGAQMAVVVLVGGPKDPFDEVKSTKSKARPRRGKKIADEVAEKVKVTKSSKKAPSKEVATKVETPKEETLKKVAGEESGQKTAKAEAGAETKEPVKAEKAEPGPEKENEPAAEKAEKEKAEAETGKK